MNRISRVEQFGAVLRKNFILLTRRRRVLCGLGGWAALILEVRAFLGGVRASVRFIFAMRACKPQTLRKGRSPRGWLRIWEATVALPS